MIKIITKQQVDIICNNIYPDIYGIKNAPYQYLYRRNHETIIRMVKIFNEKVYFINPKYEYLLEKLEG